MTRRYQARGIALLGDMNTRGFRRMRTVLIQSLRNLIRHTLTVAALVAVGGLIVTAAPTVRADRPAATGSASAIVAQHHCWTDAAPAGVTAGSVVVTFRGTDTAQWTRNAVVLHNALDSALYGNDHNIATVHAFCA